MKTLENLAKILFLFFAVVSLGLVTVSCSDDDEEEKTTLEKLINSAWHLQKFVEDDSAIYPEYENGYETNKLYTVIFYDNYSLTMRANPNWHDGTFSLNEKSNRMEIDITFSSQAMPTESELKMIEALQQTDKIKFVGNKLRLYYDTNKYMEFEKINLNVWNSEKQNYDKKELILKV